MGEVAKAKMPDGSSGKELGSCLSNKSMLTVVLQLLFFGCFLFVCTIGKP